MIQKYTSIQKLIFTKIFSNNHYKNALNIYVKNKIQSSISNTNLNYGFYISHCVLKILYIYMTMIHIKYY